MSTREDRIKGVLTGQAVGDALGVPYETGKQVPVTGPQMIGGGYGFAPAEYSDDSQQMVCVALAKSQPAGVAVNLLKWYASGPPDIGIQTRAVMSKVKTPLGLVRASRAYARKQESRPVPAGWYPGTGNGSLMRTGPVCLPFLGDRKKIAEVARKVSDLTHADPYSGDACVIWSLAIDMAVDLGENFSPEMATEGIAFLPADRQEFWQDTTYEALRCGPEEFRRGNGSAVGAYMCALSAVADSENLEHGLRLAVEAGGDTDTVAAIAGALLGAWDGASAVPAQWRKAVWGWPGRTTAADLERLAVKAAGLAA